MTSILRGRHKNVQITDLDQSDSQQQPIQESKKPILHKKRQPQRPLMTMTGNFNRRSRSVECNISPLVCNEGEKVVKLKPNINESLQAKNKPMEQLLERLSTLHKFNEQFADENQKLRLDLKQLDKRFHILQKQIDNCDKCHKLKEELTKSQQQNKSFEGDLSMMKTLVYRLNMQIEKYQDQLRQKNSKDGNIYSTSQTKEISLQQQQKSSSQCTPWQQESVHRHTLAPLLKSYDEMIRDKDELAQQYQREFDQFAGELKRALEHNNQLLRENDELKNVASNWKEERVRLQAKVDVCRSKAEAQTRKSDLAKEKLVAVMQCYEQKLQTLALDLEHLQTAYARCKAELVALKSVNAQPKDTIATSLQECKELLEQLKEQHNKEKQSLERNIRELNERNYSSEAKILELQHENKSSITEVAQHIAETEELRKRNDSLKRSVEQVKRSRDRLKSRLRIALQWAQKLEQGQADVQNTWDALKRLETIVKHKESQVRGLQARHLEEIDKLEKKLAQKEETIRTILKGRIMPNVQL